MLGLESVKLNFVGLVLRLLLQPTRSGGQLVLLLPCLGAHVERQLADGRHIVNNAPQLVQLFADVIQFPGVRRQVVSVPFPGLSAVLDASHGTVRTENGIRYFVQHVRVLHLAFHHKSLSLRTLCLHVVLPEVSLFLAETRLWVVVIVGVACGNKLVSEYVLRP